jgi:DNA relaxase NicK
MGIQVNSDFDASTVVLDWLSFTVPFDDALNLSSVAAAASWLAHQVFGGGVPLERGRYGYTSAYSVLGSGAVLYHEGRPEMGVHVELPATALAVVGMDVAALLSFVARHGGRATRVDLALDSDTPIDMFRRAILDGEAVTKSHVKKSYEMQSLFEDDNGLRGHTIYIGSASSERRVRIYDKAAETSTVGRIWTRIEVQHRGSAAQAVFELLHDSGDRDGASVCISAICGAIDFRVGDGNTTRKCRAGWWSAIVGGVDRWRFRVVSVPATVERAYDWVCKQVSSSMAMVSASFGSDAWLHHVMLYGSSRMTELQKSMALQYQGQLIGVSTC